MTTLQVLRMPLRVLQLKTKPRCGLPGFEKLGSDRERCRFGQCGLSLCATISLGAALAGGGDAEIGDSGLHQYRLGSSTDGMPPFAVWL